MHGILSLNAIGKMPQRRIAGKSEWELDTSAPERQDNSYGLTTELRDKKTRKICRKGMEMGCGVRMLPHRPADAVTRIGGRRLIKSGEQCFNIICQQANYDYRQRCLTAMSSYLRIIDGLEEEGRCYDSLNPSLLSSNPG